MEIVKLILNGTVKNVSDTVEDIIVNGHGLKYSKDKINDFIRYIRLTSHGVFDERKLKIKKVKPSVEHVPTKFITRVDHSKINYNIPDSDKDLFIKFNYEGKEVEKKAIVNDGIVNTPDGGFICNLKELSAWKYNEEDEYKPLFTAGEGMFEQIPIKFKRK
jgi:hypothetical protein